jgi:hypothetical protein
MTKKGQAAMEFLMTYGWAILAAIIVIGILGYYYFSKDTLTPNAGIVNAPFYLLASNVKTDGVNLELKNNGGDTLTVISVNVTGTCNAGAVPSPASVDAGVTTTANIACTPGSAGDTFKGDITVYYTVEGSSLEQTSTGSMTKTIAA